MPETSERQLSADQSRLVASIIREQLARRRISRQHLADQAKISISTLEKALSGRRPFTLATTVRLEEALGVPLRKTDGGGGEIGSAPANLAPGHLGFYSRPAVAWIIPDQEVSEHPPARVSTGQAYVTAIINTLMQSPDWCGTDTRPCCENSASTRSDSRKTRLDMLSSQQISVR